MLIFLKNVKNLVNGFSFETENPFFIEIVLLSKICFFCFEKNVKIEKIKNYLIVAAFATASLMFPTK